MVTKEELKKEIDKLPTNLLAEVYAFLLQKTAQSKHSKTKLTIRDFGGKLDGANLRDIAYE